MKKRNRTEAENKAEALVEKMTIDEMISQLSFDAPAIDRLYIPAYNWWNEALHGVANAGTATVFPQAIGMAAMFDELMMRRIGDVIAEEGRAKYNMQVHYGDRGIFKGLTFWSPNINIFRDPRWGRGQETYGEDPYLTSRLGVAFVKGIQGTDPVLKAAACAKHFAVHSGPENLRHEFNAVVSEKDLRETYLPAFKALVKEAGVEAVMGAYNRTNGEPCCGSIMLLKKILRGEWKFKGHVVSDCWALRDFHEKHKVTKSPEESAALALNAGCDLNCGCTFQYLKQAYHDKLVSKEQIKKAAVRLFTTRYLLGLFEGSKYDSISYDVVECRAHRNLAVKAAQKSFVLLKNNDILPLDIKKIHSVAVIGPDADSRTALMGNYHGISSRYVTVLEGIQQVAGNKITVRYAQGCSLTDSKVERLAKSGDRLAEAQAAAELSDVVILCLGFDETIEGEGKDIGNVTGTDDIQSYELPTCQRELFAKITETGKPVILVIMTGKPVDLCYADVHAAAVLQIWYPGAEGGIAVADILMGRISPSGKLPVTFYRNLDDLPAYTDYSMNNRTYRYIKQSALYPFGFGLTYSHCEVTRVTILDRVTRTSGITVSVQIANTGKNAVQEIVQLYIKDTDSPFAVRNWSLCAFHRVSLDPGENRTVICRVSPSALQCIDERGHAAVTGRHFTLYAGISQPDARSCELTGTRPAEAEIILAE